MKNNQYQDTDDAMLMSRIRLGDTGAFDELYNRYSNRLLHYFYRMLGGNEDLAQDFLQTLFMKLVEKPQRFKKGYNFKSWVFTIAHNMCKNEYRRLETKKRYFADIENDNGEQISGYNNFDDQIDKSKFRIALDQELAKIEPDHKSIFILRYQQQLSIPEIQSIIGCSEGTVKSRLFYTTKKLAKCLSEFHPLK